MLELPRISIITKKERKPLIEASGVRILHVWIEHPLEFFRGFLQNSLEAAHCARFLFWIEESVQFPPLGRELLFRGLQEIAKHFHVRTAFGRRKPFADFLVYFFLQAVERL